MLAAIKVPTITAVRIAILIASFIVVLLLFYAFMVRLTCRPPVCSALQVNSSWASDDAPRLIDRVIL